MRRGAPTRGTNRQSANRCQRTRLSAECAASDSWLPSFRLHPDRSGVEPEAKNQRRLPNYLEAVVHFLSPGGPSSVEADGMASRIQTRGTSSLQLSSSVSHQKRCTTRSNHRGNETPRRARRLPLTRLVRGSPRLSPARAGRDFSSASRKVVPLSRRGSAPSVTLQLILRHSPRLERGLDHFTFHGCRRGDVH